MKKRLAIAALVVACTISSILNIPNLRTIHAFAEIKNGARLGYVQVMRVVYYDEYFLGE